MHSLRARRPRCNPFRRTPPPAPICPWPAHLLSTVDALDGDCALELLHLVRDGRVAAPPHARAGELDPSHPCEARGPLPHRPRLLTHLLLELTHALGLVRVRARVRIRLCRHDLGVGLGLGLGSGLGLGLGPEPQPACGRG